MKAEEEEEEEGKAGLIAPIVFITQFIILVKNNDGCL